MLQKARHPWRSTSSNRPILPILCRCESLTAVLPHTPIAAKWAAMTVEEDVYSTWPSGPLRQAWFVRKDYDRLIRNQTELERELFQAHCANLTDSRRTCARGREALSQAHLPDAPPGAGCTGAVATSATALHPFSPLCAK